MMRKIVLTFMLLSLAGWGYSQSYTTAIGVKGGNSGGIGFGGGGLNLKHFISSSNALEFTVGGGDNHIRLQGLYEWQKNISDINGLEWYAGLGASVGLWNRKYAHPNGKDIYDSGLYLGANGIIGLDWNLEPELGLPIGLALDTGPYIGLINSGFFGWGGGFAIRYILK